MSGYDGAGFWSHVKGITFIGHVTNHGFQIVLRVGRNPPPSGRMGNFAGEISLSVGIWGGMVFTIRTFL